MKKNNGFDFDLKFENIPIFKGKKLTLEEIKKKIKDMDLKFN